MTAKTAARKIQQRRLSPAPAFRIGGHRPAPDSTPNLLLREDPEKQGKEARAEEVRSAGGPKTPEGKAVSARNATTHGMFCRQTVLPHLGEDPEGYRALLATLIDQIKPRNLFEMQYLELWASASWKLRRLSRLEAELWEQPDRAPAERLAEIDKLARLQARLCRQMDKSLNMLGHDVPDLLHRRAREEILLMKNTTEAECVRDPHIAEIIERMARRESRENAIPAVEFDIFDNSPDDDATPNKKCENEPSLAPLSEGEEAGGEVANPHPPQSFRQYTPVADTSLSPVPTEERCPMRADRRLQADRKPVRP